MRIIISKNRVTVAFFYLLINIGLIAAILLSNNNRIVLASSTIIQLFVSILIIYKLQKTFFSTGLLFVLFLFVFNFGQVVLSLPFFRFAKQHLFVDRRVSVDVYINSCIFAFICIFSLVIGYILFANKNENNDIHELLSTSRFIKDLSQVKKIALLVFCLSLIPAVYIDIAKIIQLKSGGYLSTYLVTGTGIGKYLDILGKYCKPAMGVLIFANSNRKKVAKRLFVIFTLYVGIMMISGDRGSNIIYLISFVVIYFKFVEKIKFRTFLLMSIGAYLVLSVISAISIFRYTDFSYDSFVDALANRSDEGIITAALTEFGDSLIALARVVENIPSYHSYNYGLTYIVAPITVIPKIPSVINDLFLDSYTFFLALPEHYQAGMGGSFIAEVYYNFGWLGSPFVFIVGVLLNYFDNTILNNKNARTVACGIVILPLILLWTRDFFSVLFSCSFWFCILLCAIKFKQNHKCDVTPTFS